jgi:hypothetical protein
MPAPNIRDATPLERSNWERWVNYYEGPVTTAVVGFNLVTTVAARAQTVLDKHGIVLPIGPLFTVKDADTVNDTLNRYNILGRLILGVHAQSYGIRLDKGDMDILVDPALPSEAFEQDVYPALTLSAIPLIILAIVYGTILVAGIWGVTKVLEQVAERDKRRHRERLIQADAAVMKMAPAIRADWLKLRQYATAQEQKIKKETGVMSKVFGEDIGANIGLGVLILLGIMVLPHALDAVKKR